MRRRMMQDTFVPFLSSAWMLTVICIVGAICGFLVATFAPNLMPWSYAKESKPNKVESAFYVDPVSLDFGLVREKGDFTHVIKLVNKSTKDLKVTRIELSCDCISIEPSSFIIKSGGSIPVTINFDLIRGKEKDKDKFKFEFSPIIEGNTRQSFLIHGQVARHGD